MSLSRELKMFLLRLFGCSTFDLTKQAAERGLARYCAVMVQDVLRCADAAGSGSAADIFQLAGKRARSGDPEDAPASSKIPVKPPQ